MRRLSGRSAKFARAALVALGGLLVALTGDTFDRSGVRAAAAAPPRSGRPAAPRAVRDAVEKRLRASDRPPDPAELAALGPGAEAAVLAIAGDTKAEALLRARATAALAHAASPRARAFLIQVVSNPSRSTDPAELAVLRRAAVALGWQGGPAAPEPLGLLLGHPDADVRTDAAVGLGLTRLPAAADRLRAHLAVEKDARVRGHVARQLRTIEDSIKASGRDPGAPAGAAAGSDRPTPPPPSGLGGGRNPTPPMRSGF